MKNEIDVSIIIPAYSGAETVGSLVNKLLSETRMAVERIIVDDGSADETASVLRQRHDGLLILTEQANQSV
ncbi:glycosyltransferase [Citrobacter arsenatis]|uniref:glycosyltransferase n=1 Tax=Citrobacter arsenatis TaxID=2546350 RepID=UPI00300E648F